MCDTAGATTPLHAAAFGGHAAVVEVLLERGADALLRSKSGETPLHAACRGRRDAVVALLAKHIYINKLPRDIILIISKMHPLLIPPFTNKTLRRAVKDYLAGGDKKKRIVDKYGEISKC